MRGLPLDPPHAIIALDQATDREDIFEIVLRAARGKLHYAALISVHGDGLRGRRAIAADGFDGAACDNIESLRLARNAVPVFEAAIASRAASVGPIITGEPFVDGMLDVLGATPVALVLPITVGTRTVALVVAHRGAAAFNLADVADLIPVATAANPALARVIASRGKAIAPPARAQSEGYEVEVSIDRSETVADEPIDSVATRRAALAEHRRTESWPEVAETIRALVRDGLENGDPDEDEQLALLVELGHVEADRLAQPDRAIATWRSAQTIDAGDDRILDALEALFVRQGRWLECVELLDKRVALIDEQGPRIAMLLNLATMVEERLDDHESAIEAYERILTWDPAHPIASRQLEGLLTAQEQWEPLAALLLDRASRRGDVHESIAALEAVAQMYEDKVGDVRAAFLVWVAVLRRDPAHAHVIDRLERLAPIANAWDELLPECALIAEELETKKHPQTAAHMWMLVARSMRDHVGNRGAAMAALNHVLRLAPSETDALVELLALLRLEQRWPEIEALLAHRVEHESDVGRQADLYVELGELRETELADPAGAIAYYERALVCEPESSPVLVALHRRYLEDEIWDELARILPRLIDALAPTAPLAVILDLHVELGTVLADHLERRDDAVRAFHDALALDPKHAAAFAGVTRIYEATGHTEGLLETTEAEIDVADRAEQIRRYPDLAAAWLETGNSARAAACWEKLLALEPKNLVAHAGLVRSLRAGDEWAALADALRVHAALAAGEERLPLLRELAALLETRLDDARGAIAVDQEILALDPHDRAALDSLARLHDALGRPQLALDALNRLLADTTEPRARGDLLQRIGQLQLDTRDTSNARLSLGESISLDSSNARAREAMARVHLQNGELAAAGEALMAAAKLSKQPADTIRCLADAALLYRHRLGDSERARKCLHWILEIDPENADAKQARADLLHATQEWEALWPHLDAEVRRVRGDAAVAPADRNELYLRAARCAVELSNFTIAIELFDLASAAVPSSATMCERAEALYRNKTPELAAAAYQAIANRPADLDRTQVVATFRRLAQIHTELNKASQAQLFHQKVLDLEPTHRDTLAELAELHLGRGRFDEAIACWRTLLADAPVAERITLLERIGDLYRHQQANAPRAMSMYLEALELDAGNRRILQRLLDLQTEGGKWHAAVQTIGQFLEHETDRARRAAYFVASAEIRRTELKDTAGALEAYEHAVDALLAGDDVNAGTRQRAFEAFHLIDALLTAEKSWKQLEEAYRRMIKRVRQDDPVLVHLWHSLGEIYRTRLVHLPSAIQAFEVAHSLDPDKAASRARILTELYARIGHPEAPEQVTESAAKLVEVDPTNPDTYRALGRASLEAGRIDEAWCVCRALVVLKQAKPEEAALYKKYQTLEVRKATGILDDDSWALVRHSDEDRVISAIFALVWESVVALRAGSPKSFELKSKERLPVETDTRVVAKIFRHAAKLLNVPLPDVYVQPRRPGRLLLANCIEKGRLVPAVIVGRDLMTGYRDTEIATAVGAMLALMRPTYSLKLTLGTAEELEAVVAAAAQLVGKKVGRASLEPLIEVFVPEIQKRLTRPTAEALLALVERLPAALDLARWRTAVDAAAQRSGLLVAGELAAAARMISSDTQAGQRPTQRVQELVAYSVSPNYFAVRQHLGLVVA